MGRITEWSIEATPRGWVLVVDPPISALPIADRVLRVMIDVPMVDMRLGVTFIFGLGAGALSFWLSHSSLVALIAGIVTAIAASWPLFFPSKTTREALPSTRRVVELRDGVLTTDEGDYDPCFLDSLHATAEGAPAGRRYLMFTTAAIQNATLLGWPGVRDTEADALVSQLRALGAASSRSGANKRINLTR